MVQGFTDLGQASQYRNSVFLGHCKLGERILLILVDGCFALHVQKGLFWESKLNNLGDPDVGRQTNKTPITVEP